MNGMQMNILTVFTPTYNRAYALSRLYESLCQQTNKSFEWLVIDDGSTDNTRSIIERFINDNIISIKYVYCENGGKHRAINHGVRLANGEFFFIVDSDDCLINNAVDVIFEEKNKILNIDMYAGLCLRRAWAGKQDSYNKKFPFSCFDSNSLELPYIYNFNVDKAEVFRTDVLKCFPFPEIVGENFVPEALVWFRIASKGLKLRCIDKEIYLCEYLEDGLTNNFRRNLKRNNKGFGLYYKECLRYKEIPCYPYKLKALLRWMQCLLYRFID